MATAGTVSKVRSLYKRILVLHRFLPADLKALGDRYVKDEFRRHKNAAKGEVETFLKEWQVRHKKQWPRSKHALLFYRNLRD